MAASADATPAPPAVIEGPGRYVIYAGPAGGWVIARATGLCETCRDCGCGQQQDPLPIPEFAASALAELLATGTISPAGMLRHAGPALLKGIRPSG